MRINFRRKVNINNKRNIEPVVNFAVIQLAQIARVALDVFKQFLVILQKKEIIIISIFKRQESHVIIILDVLKQPLSIMKRKKSLSTEIVIILLLIFTVFIFIILITIILLINITIYHHLQVEQHRGISKAKGSSATETPGLREHLSLVVGSEDSVVRAMQ